MVFWFKLASAYYTAKEFTISLGIPVAIGAATLWLVSTNYPVTWATFQ